jgi:wyosine [tRNA(Phe)-imidazoG37] synthetase (radical SAM superfamily)
LSLVKPLETSDHNRNVTGLTYVYPVVSRRAGGVSIGINLNTNNACNWACVYCQVPNLTRGVAPATNLPQLKTELNQLLQNVLQGDFMERFVAPEHRVLQDIAFSGNGEPTGAAAFPEAVEIVLEAVERFELQGKIKLVVISNGSHTQEEKVQAALKRLAACGGEIWFKLDRGTREDIFRINKIHLDPELILKRLAAAAQICPTWVQTCMVAWDGVPPGEAEVNAWLGLLERAVKSGTPLKGVLLYSLGRPSHQPEAHRIAQLPLAWLEALGAQVKALGLEVRITP